MYYLSKQNFYKYFKFSVLEQNYSYYNVALASSSKINKYSTIKRRTAPPTLGIVEALRKNLPSGLPAIFSSLLIKYQNNCLKYLI